MRRLTQQRGQTLVLTVVFSTVLIGCAALVIDIGSWFREQRDTQRIADAAALAGAQGLPSSAQASALAVEYTAKNGGTNPTIDFPAADRIRVEIRADAPGFFAKLFGVESVQVKGKATARSFSPNEARWAAPFGVDERTPELQCKPEPCFGDPVRLDLDKVGPGGFRIINLDGSRGGTGPPILADWIERGFDGYMPLDWYYSDPGAKYNSSQVKAAMDKRVGTEMLFPVYRSVKGSGANLEYEVVGWVGVFVTGYQFKGSKDSWIDGRFTRVIWEGIENRSADPSVDLGARSIELIE